MDLDTLLDRALALLGFMDFRAAAMVLVNAGVPSEHAFLALKAAEILGIKRDSWHKTRFKRS